MDIKPSCENCKYTFNAIDEAPCNHCIRALSDFREPDEFYLSKLRKLIMEGEDNNYVN